MGLKRNLTVASTANIASSLTRFFSIPSFAYYLGFAEFSLLGIFTGLQAVFVVFDQLITPPIIRNVVQESEKKLGDKKSSEYFVPYLILALVIITSLTFLTCLFSPDIAGGLGITEYFGEDRTAFLINLMVFVSLMRIFESIINGFIVGHRHHEFLALMGLGSTFLRFGGSLIVVIVFEGKIETVFYWQLIVTLLYVFFCCSRFHKYISLNVTLADAIKVFLGMRSHVEPSLFFILLSNLVFFQGDKFLAAKFFDSVLVGSFTFAAILASCFQFFFYPIISVFFPSLIKKSCDNAGASNDFDTFLLIFKIFLIGGFVAVILSPIFVGFCSLFFAEQNLLWLEFLPLMLLASWLGTIILFFQYDSIARKASTECVRPALGGLFVLFFVISLMNMTDPIQITYCFIIAQLVHLALILIFSKGRLISLASK